MLLSKYSYLSRHGLKLSSTSSCLSPYHNIRQYSIDTPPEDLQKNVPALVENIDMKNLALQSAGGRSSVSGVRATVFGASSAMGTHAYIHSAKLRCISTFRPTCCECIGSYGISGYIAIQRRWH